MGLGRMGGHLLMDGGELRGWRKFFKKYVSICMYLSKHYKRLQAGPMLLASLKSVDVLERSNVVLISQ